MAQNPTHSKQLEDQAAAAALYVTEPQKKTRDYRKEATSPLDANGKLTSAGAAASLKRADARDLPSFPSAGLAQAAAGGAAGLAVQNTKSPEWWKPGDASAGASAAALAANGYKMKPLWEPEASAAGSKAALLAHQKGHGLNLWEPTASDKALMAATGAAAGQKGAPVGRKAKDESGLADRYPDERNAAKNALSAATSVHKTTRNNDLPGYTDEEAAKIRQQATVKGLDTSLFGSNPLIGPELQEQQHQAGLHAAAVSMAQGMYGKREAAYREKMGAAHAGSRAAAGRALDDDSDDEDTPMSFMGLQEAAQKLANERLAKMNNPDAAFREHYGTNSPPPKSRLSMFGGGSLRKKDSDEDMSDERKSRKIRGEMNLFQDKLKEIDARKRKDDRSALLAAAQRNVKALSAEMDEDVFQRTGKMSPAMKADWEAQARARAQASSEERNANYGKIAIGGGKYMDQTEIDGIAQTRLQPTLDAITAKAAHDREVDEENRIAEEERKRLERENKEQEKYTNMKVKEEWKRFKAEEKAEEDARKQEEKAIHEQEKAAQRDAKMQEKFEHTKEKEHENELKAIEKEHDKQQKEEWKAFKEQEKEEKAKKDDNRLSKGSRLGSIFRRKSKKEKEPSLKSDKRESTVIPAGEATTTTTITGGEPAPTPAVVSAAPVTEHREASHHEEPHHSPLAALEETPEAKAANQQKPGGDLLSMFKRKKANQDDKKRHSTAESATTGVATGAVAGAAATTLVGKDEPGKAQPSTGTPAPEAMAPETVESEKAAASPPAVSAAGPSVADQVDEPAAEPVTFSAPATTTPAVAPVPETSASDVSNTAIPIAFPVRPADASESSELMDGQAATRVVSEDNAEFVDAPDQSIVPATTTGATVTDSKVDRAEKPAVHDAGHETTPAPAVAAVAAPVEQAAPVHEEIAEKTAKPSETVVAAAPLNKSVDAPTTQAPETLPAESESAPPLAMGSDKPVTKEVNHSKILDTIEPRVNVGKPGATGNEKLAAATADMRGIDHAGSTTAAAAPVSALGPAAAGPVAEGTSTTHAKSTVDSSATSAHHAGNNPALATHEGDKVAAPVSDRIAISSEAAAAAEDAGDKGGKHGTPRQGEKQKQNRLSGFFKNKLGMKIKEHKGADGVTVTPTTQYTTMGKYVDPTDKHSTTNAAAIPANAAVLDAAPGPSTSESGSKTAATATNDIDASGIAVDPAFQRTEDTETRGRAPGSKVHSEESDEARDTVAEQLSPPKMPGLPRASESPARETRFKEELFG